MSFHFADERLRVARFLHYCSKLIIGFGFSLLSPEPEFQQVHVPSDAEPCQYKVISHRILRDDFAEGPGDLKGGPLVSLPPAGKAKLQADSVHVSIEGNNQPGTVHPSPATWVYLVLSDHPSQE